jgi:hypothetical protein
MVGLIALGLMVDVRGFGWRWYGMVGFIGLVRVTGGFGWLWLAFGQLQSPSWLAFEGPGWLWLYL